MVWFNSNVDDRYKDKQFHVYYHCATGISKDFSDKVKSKLKSKNKNVYSLSGLKTIKESFKKINKLNVTISAQYFRVYGKKGAFNNYLEFDGASHNINFSLRHFDCSIGWSKNCRTTGVGLTTCTAGASYSTASYNFNGVHTDFFRNVFSVSKVKSKAQS